MRKKTRELLGKQSGGEGWKWRRPKETKPERRASRLGGGRKGREKVLCCVDYCVFVIWNGISCRYSISCP